MDEHLRLLEEARKRDHRKLGRELDLFMVHPFAPGATFWTERGTTVYNILNAYMREIQLEDYREIKTPLLYNRKLWELSGHWGKYRDNMILASLARACSLRCRLPVTTRRTHQCPETKAASTSFR